MPSMNTSGWGGSCATAASIGGSPPSRALGVAELDVRAINSGAGRAWPTTGSVTEKTRSTPRRAVQRHRPVAGLADALSSATHLGAQPRRAVSIASGGVPQARLGDHSGQVRGRPDPAGPAALHV